MSVELSILSNTEIKEVTESIPPIMESSSSNGKPQLAEGKATSEFGTESTMTIDDDEEDERMRQFVSRNIERWKSLLSIGKPQFGTESTITIDDDEEDERMRQFVSWHIEQVKASQSVFNYCDQNGDGRISPAELQKCIEIIGEKLPAVLVEVVAKFLTTNGDGLMSFDFDGFLMFLKAGRDKEYKEKYRRRRNTSAGNERLMRTTLEELPKIISAANEFRRGIDAEEMQGQNQASRGTNVHHESSNDLTNTTLEQKDLSFKAFAREIVVNPSSHKNLLKACIIVLIAFAKDSTTSFDFQFGKTTNTSRTLLSFEDALFAFFPEMAQMSMFMICYVMIFMLVLPLQPGEQIFPALLLIFAAFIYFSELVRKASASRVDVACGGLVKLPLFRFTTLGAVWLSLICGLVIFLMVYLNWRFIYRGKPRVGGDLNHLEDRLPELLEGDSNV